MGVYAKLPVTSALISVTLALELVLGKNSPHRTSVTPRLTAHPGYHSTFEFPQYGIRWK